MIHTCASFPSCWNGRNFSTWNRGLFFFFFKYKLPFEIMLRFQSHGSLRLRLLWTTGGCSCCFVLNIHTILTFQDARLLTSYFWHQTAQWQTRALKTALNKPVDDISVIKSVFLIQSVSSPFHPWRRKSSNFNISKHHYHSLISPLSLLSLLYTFTLVNSMDLSFEFKRITYNCFFI